MSKHMIDLNADPIAIERWEVIEHARQGLFEWDPDKIRFHLVEGQRRGISGDVLLAKLKEEQVCGVNVNVLDYLLDHPSLIPTEWEGRDVIFPGTLYRGMYGDLCLRCLKPFGTEWTWNRYVLDFHFEGHNRVLVFAGN